jgi:hypothetical protein
MESIEEQWNAPTSSDILTNSWINIADAKKAVKIWILDRGALPPFYLFLLSSSCATKDWFVRYHILRSTWLPSLQAQAQDGPEVQERRYPLRKRRRTVKAAALAR